MGIAIGIPVAIVGEKGTYIFLCAFDFIQGQC